MPIFPALFDERLKKVGEPEQEMPGAIEQSRRRILRLRMILLVITLFAMAIPAEDDRHSIKVSSGNMMPFQRAPIERGTIVHSEEEVDAWLGRQRVMLVAAVKRGPVVIS